LVLPQCGLINDLFGALLPVGSYIAHFVGVEARQRRGWLVFALRYLVDLSLI
jgi:hypothetical protein